MDVKTQKVKLIIFALVIVAAIVGGIFIVNKNKDAKFQEQLNLGNEALRNLDYEGAVTAFANAIGIDPKQVEAYLGITEAYVAMEDYVSASEYLIKGWKDIPEPKILSMLDTLSAKDFNALGKEYLSQGNPNLSQGAFEEALKKEPTNEEAQKDLEDSLNHPNYIPEGEQNPENNAGGTEEDNTSANTPGMNGGTLTEDELWERNENISRAYRNYIQGWIDNDRVKALCDYWIPILEAEKEKDTELASHQFWGKNLCELYYMNQNFDACKNLLSELYALTGSETYICNVGGLESTASSPNQTAGITSTIDEYGRGTHDYWVIPNDDGSVSYTEDMTTTYSADGKMQKFVQHNEYNNGDTMHSEYVYQYDGQGRIVSVTEDNLTTSPYSDSSSRQGTESYNYSGDAVTYESVYTINGETQSPYVKTGNMDEFGLIQWNYNQ